MTFNFEGKSGERVGIIGVVEGAGA